MSSCALSKTDSASTMVTLGSVGAAQHFGDSLTAVQLLT